MNKKILSLFSVLVLSLMLFTNVYALNIVEIGERITQEGEYESSRFAAGNSITNKAIVNGLSFVAGNEVSLEGESEYGFYAGNIITINENIKKDVFVAGNSITVLPDAILSRDVYIAGSSITINANVTRDLRVAGSLIDLSGITVGGDAYIRADKIILDKDTVINGKLQYIETSEVEGLDIASIGSKEKVKAIDIKYEYSFSDRLMRFLENSLAALIVMLVLFYLIPSSKEKIDNLKISVGSIVKTALIGLCLIIVTPIIALITIFTGILTPLAIITALVYGIIIYLSSLVVYYLIGKYIATKTFKNQSIYLMLATGIILGKLIELIPYIGVFVKIVILLYGFGLIFNFIKSRDK